MTEPTVVAPEGPGSIEDRIFEIEFLDARAEAYCFTFG